MAKSKDVIHAYRHLYRAGLKAVCHSQPASTGVRDLLRQSFRAPSATFEDRPIKRTIWFLKNAAKSTGIEHKVVRNILLVKYWKDHNARRNAHRWSSIVTGKASESKRHSVVSDSAYVHYGKTIEMLNKTMHLCLPLP